MEKDTRSDQTVEVMEEHLKLPHQAPPLGTSNLSSPLTIIELLESILVHLGIKDLFICRGVCRAWKAVLADSVKLRRKMWLTPYENVTIMPLSRPMTRAIFEDKIFLSNPYPEGENQINLMDLDGTVRSVVEIELDLNPLLTPDLFFMNCSRDIGVILNRSCYFFTPVHEETRLIITSVNTHRLHQSWREMLLTNPPCTSVQVLETASWLDPISSPGRIGVGAHIENRSGIRLQDVLDAVIAYCRKVQLDRECGEYWCISCLNLENEKDLLHTLDLILASLRFGDL